MIKNYNLIRAILSEPWFISRADAETMAPLLLSVFKPDHFAIDGRGNLASVKSTASASGGASGISKVGVLEIRGTLTKYGTWCNYGMQGYASFLRDMYRDPEIGSIVIDFDTPGGTVAGTEELANVIKEAPKPVVAFVSDMTCSAGYWLASACREIIANNTTAEIGSIGVMCTYHDLSAYYEKMGIKVHNIYAPQSTDKHGESKAIMKGDYSATEVGLSVLADKFISAVKANRPAVTDDQLTGKVFFAQDVVGTLIDGIGSFESAVARAAELAASTNNHDKKSETMSKQTFTMLAMAAGLAVLETADGSISLNAEQAAAVEQYLKDAKAKADADSKAASDLKAANDRIATQETTITSLEAKIEELNKKPGAVGAGVTKETDANGAADSPATSYAEAHKAAMDYHKRKNQ